MYGAAHSGKMSLIDKTQKTRAGKISRSCLYPIGKEVGTLRRGSANVYWIYLRSWI